MIKITKSLEVDFTAQQMFDLVADYPSYPKFIKACKRAEIVEQVESDNVIAEMELCFIGICKTFRTSTTFTPYKCIIIELVNGPFDVLEGDWIFEDIGNNHSRISTNMIYSFRNSFLEKIVGSFFEDYSANLINSFHQRAKEIYSNAKA